MNTAQVTSHFGSSGVAATLAAAGDEQYVHRFAKRWEKKGYKVTLQPPEGRRQYWCANAVYCDPDQAMHRAYGHARINNR